MKSLAILAILLSAYYITMTKVVMTQLHNLENFYGNMDKYASEVAASKQPAAGSTMYQSAQTIAQPGTR